jgi:hypothetical protein
MPVDKRSNLLDLQLHFPTSFQPVAFVGHIEHIHLENRELVRDIASFQPVVFVSHIEHIHLKTGDLHI